MANDDVVALDVSHDRSKFDCGELSLNNWLRLNAIKSGKADSARTYVVLEGRVVVGYYALAAHSVEPDWLDDPSHRKHEIGGVLLAKLAVDRSHQKCGLGGVLLIDAMRRAVSVAEQVGAEMVFVDALHEAAALYYERYGFRRFERDGLRLYLPMKEVRATLQASDSAG